jgi:hypothetical protein
MVFALLVVLLASCFVPRVVDGFAHVHRLAAGARPAASVTAAAATRLHRATSLAWCPTAAITRRGLDALRAAADAADSSSDGISNGSGSGSGKGNSAASTDTNFKLNLANSLTLARIAAIPFFMVAFVLRKVRQKRVRPLASLFAAPSPGHLPVLCSPPRQKTLGVLIYVASCITDFVDGYVARKYNQMSAFGAFLDPVADKVRIANTNHFRRRQCHPPPFITTTTFSPPLMGS